VRRFTFAITIVLVALAASAILAEARHDVRVHTDKDSKGNVIYRLANAGDKGVRVTVQHKKTCASTTTKREPTEREYRLAPKRSTHLRKVLANSDCRHTYRIVKAEYY